MDASRTPVKEPRNPPGPLVALVSGANRGLGLGIAEGLAAAGYQTVLGARDPGALEATVSRLQSSGKLASPVALDVSVDTSVTEAAAHVIAQFGRIDVLVNNAGVLLCGRTLGLSELSTETLERTLQVNLVGAHRLTRAVLPGMLARDFGRVVNISSGLGSVTELAYGSSDLSEVSSPAYRMSKAALNVMTLLAAREARGRRVLVNACCPGWVGTDMGGESAPRSILEGVDTPLWLATLPDDGPSGGFFRDRKAIEW